MGPDLRLGQVPKNSENVQNLSILHGFIKASLFPFSTNFQLLLRSANLPHKRMGIALRLSHVLWNYENDQNLAVCHSYFNASLFPFSTNLQLLLRLANLPHKRMGLDLRLGHVCGILRTIKIQQFVTVISTQVCFPFLLICSYYYAWQIYHTKECVQTYVWVKFCEILKTFKIQLFVTVLIKQVCFPFILICSYYYAYQIYHTNACV